MLLDIDGDGLLSHEEIEASEERQTETVNNALSLLTTSGVIGALFISVLLPLCLTSPLSISEESIKFFSESSLDNLSCIYSGMIYISLCFSFLSVFYSSRVYLQLSFWMPNLEMKIWFLSEISMVPPVVMTMATVLFSTLAVPIGVTVTAGPKRGLIALLPFVSGGVCLLINANFGEGDVFVMRQLHKYTATVVGASNNQARGSVI